MGQLICRLLCTHKSSARCTRYIVFSAAILIGTTPLLTGCGGGNGTTPPPSQAVAITVQPLSQTVPIGSAATFTVTATGTTPLSYQWTENGVDISGATSASYSTPAVELGDASSTSVGSFQVTVTNSVNSATSKSATLTAGPRSPKAGDLRYLLNLQVDVPGLLNPDTDTTGNVTVELGGNVASNFANNAIGTPLGMGSSYICEGGTCLWPYDYQLLPPPVTGLDMYYQGGNYSNFAADLQSFAAPNVVFASLDLEPTENAYAVSWVKTAQTGGFDYRIDPVVPAGPDQQAQIQAQATLDGTESRVITALSFDASSNAILVSYGWTSDISTVYEMKTSFVPAGGDVGNNVLSAATTLANNAYIISAFGGNDTDGYILIGMRIQGDSLPRPINQLNTSDEPPYATTVVNLRELGSATFVNEQ